MRTIYKYPIQLVDRQLVKMPAGATILTAAAQGPQLCLWCEVASDASVVGREIRVYGTGHEMEASVVLKYISTVHAGALVWHVYERL